MASLGRLAALVLAVGILAAVSAPDAPSALFFFFEPPAAEPGDRVTVRTAPTPKSFGARERVRPFGRPYRLYLVPNAIAGTIRSRFDPRIHFVGSLRPDKHGLGTLAFRVPPLESGSYAAAVWCPGCARHSRGRTFFVLGVDQGTVPRYRSLMLLRVSAPRATADGCPVTNPSDPGPSGLAGTRWYGNGQLWAWLPPGGVYEASPAQVARDGSMFNKLGWLPTGIGGVLTVRGQRLDAPSPPLRVIDVNWGHNTSTGRGSWASAVSFPSEGCWKLTGRVRDVSLTYVIRVIRGQSA